MNPIRIKIQNKNASVTFYLEASKEKTKLVDGRDQGMALLNIAGENSAPLRFAIEDTINSCKESPQGRTHAAKKILECVKRYIKKDYKAELLKP